MIKTLLLASSFVVGNGMGALQKNAPIFNHRYTMNTSNTTTAITCNMDPMNQIGHIPKQIYTEQVGNFTRIFQAGKTDQQQNYKGYINIENTYVARNDYNANYQNACDANGSWYYTYNFVKITPYMQFSTINITQNIVNPIDIQYGTNTNSVYEINTYITKDQKTEQIFQQYNYGSFTYNPFGIFTTQELNQARATAGYIEWRDGEEDQNTMVGTNISSSTYNDTNGTWIEIENTTNYTYTINNSTDPFYILQEIKYEHETWEDGKAPLNYNGTIYPDSILTLTFTNEIVDPTDIKDYEVVNIGGLMFEILTMPFTFISRAFSLTLFPNTPYSINIAQLFLSLFAALVFIFIIKKFVKR